MMLSNSPSTSRSSHAPRKGSLLLGISILLIVACSLQSGLQSPVPTSAQSPTPVVITVLVPAPTQPPSTEPPATSTSLVVLDTATVAPPVRPNPPGVSRGGPGGDGMDNFRISLDFNPDYFLRVYVFYSEDANEKFKAARDGRDIDSVEFEVTSPNGGHTYYGRTERNAGYCIFGGGEPDCNPWVFEDGQYRWKQGGPPVESGKYGLRITVTAQNGDTGNWLWNSQNNNPIIIDVP